MKFKSKQKILLIATLILSFGITTQCQIKAKSNANLGKKIDTYIAQKQKQYDVAGLALAVIKNGKIIHKKNYGVANLEFSVPVNDKTLFPIFSTTKLFSVVAIHKLIEQKKLSLDDKISDYVNDLPDGWKNRQIKHLLTHSSGLPDIVRYQRETEEVARQSLYKDAIRFTAGERFEYNQTNYWLLIQIVKNITGKTLADQILQTQFLASSKSVLFEGNHLKIVPNLATVYIDHENRGYLLKADYYVPEFIYGSSGLTITLDEFIAWEKKFAEGKFVSDSTKKLLQIPFEYTQSHNFSYGLSLINFEGEISYGFTGSAATAYKRFPDKDLTIILLANGMFIPNSERRGINDVVNNITAMTDEK